MKLATFEKDGLTVRVFQSYCTLFEHTVTIKYCCDERSEGFSWCSSSYVLFINHYIYFDTEVFTVYIHYRSKVWGHPDNFVFSMKTHTFIYQMSCKMNRIPAACFFPKYFLHNLEVCFGSLSCFRRKLAPIKRCTQDMAWCCKME